MRISFAVLLFVIINCKLNAQSKCTTEALSHRIDSVCKLNNVSYCEVYFNYPGIADGNSGSLGGAIRSSGIFKLEDCFLIIGDFEKHYFDLSKLVDFYISFKRKKTENDKLIMSFQWN